VLGGGFVRERLDGGELRLVDILRVDGDEALAAAGGDRLRAETFQDLHQKVPPRGGMLIDQNALARERYVFEEAQVAIHILRSGVAGFRG
jgi:hypothetical protein